MRNGNLADPHISGQILFSRQALREGNRTDAAELAVASGTVVENFNVIEDIRTGQIPGFIDMFSNTLFFQLTEERFVYRIDASRSCHAGSYRGQFIG